MSYSNIEKVMSETQEKREKVTAQIQKFYTTMRKEIEAQEAETLQDLYNAAES